MKMKKGKVLEVSFSLTLLFTSEPEGGFTVTCEELPEFLTDGETIEKALSNVEDAFMGVLEIYIHTKRKLPESIVNYARVSEPKFITKTPQAEHYPDFCFQATMPPPPIESNLSYSEIF
jgi:antitoxin HicB